MSYTAESFKSRELCEKAFTDSWEFYIFIPSKFKTLEISMLFFLLSDEEVDIIRFIPHRHFVIPLTNSSRTHLNIKDILYP